MKKFISVILAVLMMFTVSSVAFAADSDDSSFGAYKHVYIIGVDGCGTTWGHEDSPNIDRIFDGNAKTFTADTEYITVSAQNWGSILTGVAYDVHGLNNGNVEEIERSSASDNNTIFYYVRQAMPDAELVSFNCWSAINRGIIENDINVNKINDGDDKNVVASIVNYFEEGNMPTLMFVQLDSVDHAGHSYGGQTEEYYEAAEKADNYVGIIYDAIAEHDGLEDGLFIVVADHGEANGGDHGGTSYEESHVVFAVAGKTVNDTEITSARNRDVAAVALYALGIEEPAHMTSVVPEGIFGEEKEETDDGIADAFEKFFRHIYYIIVTVAARLLKLFNGC